MKISSKLEGFEEELALVKAEIAQHEADRDKIIDKKSKLEQKISTLNSQLQDISILRGNLAHRLQCIQVLSKPRQ